MIPLPNSAVARGRLFSKISRPQNIVYSGLLACAAAYTAGAGMIRVVACYVTILLLYAIATGYNNLHDEITDKLNQRHDIAQAEPGLLRRFLIICGGILALLQLVFAQPASIGITVCYFGLVAAYSHPKLRLMARGFWATGLLGLCYGGLPFLLGAAQGTMWSAAQCLSMAILQIFLLFPVIAAKDYKDIVGDTATGKRTPLVRYGHVIVNRVSTITAMLAASLYSAFAHDIGLQISVYSGLAVLYVVLVWRLHGRHGRIAKREKSLLTAVILLISLSLMSIHI
jgi:4-hydroxybenzoate polyprenyltransferase